MLERVTLCLSGRRLGYHGICFKEEQNQEDLPVRKIN